MKFKILFIFISVLASCKQSGSRLSSTKSDAQPHNEGKYLCKDRPEVGCVDHHTFPPTMKSPSEAEQKASIATDKMNLSASSTSANTTWYERCSSEINQRLAQANPDTSKVWRDTSKHLTSSWIHGLNLAAVTHIFNGPRGVAITPKHVLYVKHYGYHPQIGGTVRFLTTDNRLIERKVSGLRYVGNDNPSDYSIDITVVRLDQDLPGSITPMKLVKPDDLVYANLPVVECPVLRIDQDAKALLVLAAPGKLNDRNARFWNPVFGSLDSELLKTYTKFYENMIPGDSSSPSIAIYKDEHGISPYLLSQVTFGGPGEGTRTANYAADIQRIISGFGDTDPKYQLRFGPYEYAGHARPHCSVEATRVDEGGKCSVTVKGSGDKVIGTPKINATLISPWTAKLDLWETIASCKSNTPMVMSASLQGSSSEGVSCESAPIPGVIAPKCLIEIRRIAQTERCLVSLKRDKSSGPIDNFEFQGKSIAWDGESSKIFTASNPNANSTKLNADFNGDKTIDKAELNELGQWVVTLVRPDQSVAAPKVWGAWPQAKKPWVNIHAQDFNGDGKIDIAGRSAITGEWFLLLARPKALSFKIQSSGTWSPSQNYVDILSSDFTGDGYSDIIGRVQATGKWYIKLGSPLGLSTSDQIFGAWASQINWKNVTNLDMDGDGKPELLGMTASGKWWISKITATGSSYTLTSERAFHLNEAQSWPELPCKASDTTNVSFKVSGPGGGNSCDATIQ